MYKKNFTGNNINIKYKVKGVLKMEFQFTEEMMMKKIDERVALYKNLLYYAVKDQINGKQSDLEDYDYYVNKIEECKRVEIFLQSLFNELKEIDEIPF